jgi:M6 family metalloprotease-like protein
MDEVPKVHPPRSNISKLILVAIILFVCVGMFIASSQVKKNQTLKSKASELSEDICPEISSNQLNAITVSDSLGFAPILDSLDRSFYITSEKYKQKLGKQTPSDIRNLKEEALTRKKIVLKTMQTDPKAALQLFLPENEQPSVANVTRNCLEKKVTLEGTLEVIHKDDIDEKKSEYRYTLITNEGRVKLYPAGELPETLSSGAKIRVNGYQLDNNMVVDINKPNNVQVLEPDTLSPNPNLGVQQTVIILANFRNTPQPSLTNDEARNVVFNQANAYYAENSYHKASLAGTSVGWLTMDLDQTCETYDIQNAAISAADQKVNFKQYRRIIIVSPSECEGGQGTVGMTSIQTNDGEVNASISWVTPNFFNKYILDHELGHNFGVMHANFLNCGNDPINSENCQHEEYGNYYSTMGAPIDTPENTPHMDTYQKKVIGWLSSGNTQKITTNGTYAIGPLENTSNSLQNIVIQRSQNQDYLSVDYRQPIGYDHLLNYPGSDVFEGASVYLGGLATYLIDTSPPSDYSTSALLVGRTFRDPATGATLRTESRTNAAVSVAVTLGKTDFTPPVVELTAPQQGATVSGTMTVSANATDASGIEKVVFYTGWNQEPITDYSEPYSIQVDTTRMANGFHYISAIAYDRAGIPWNAENNIGYTGVVTVTIANTDPSPPSVQITAPNAGSNQTNPVYVSANATDNNGIYFVEFWKNADSYPFYIDYDYPFEVPLNANVEFPLGTNSVSARAYDYALNTGTAASVPFQVVSGYPTPTLALSITPTPIPSPTVTPTITPTITPRPTVITPPPRYQVTVSCGSYNPNSNTFRSFISWSPNIYAQRILIQKNGQENIHYLDSINEFSPMYVTTNVPNNTSIFGQVLISGTFYRSSAVLCNQ